MCLDRQGRGVFVVGVTSFDFGIFARDPTASMVLDRMRDGRWRKARDAAKDLCKKDRARYLPLLVEANAGLVGEMLSKGLVKEAETVLAYLETIAPAERVAQLRAGMAESAVRPPVAAGKAAAAGGAVGWALTLRAARETADGREASPADQAAVDQLVADSFVPPVDSGDDEESRVAAELAAVRKACDATGDGRWEEAKEALRDLPQRSVFRHWRMFLRGVRCVFEDDLQTARRCFGGLPAGGALALAAAAFDPVVGKASAPLRARVPLLLAATGQPEAWASPILAAAAAWKANKRFKALEELRRGSKGAFPTQRPGLGSALTDAMMPYREKMDDEDLDYADEVADWVVEFKMKRAGNSSGAVLALLRPLCVSEFEHMPPAVLEKFWQDVLKLWNEIEGPDPERDAAAWHWLGGALCRPVAFSSFNPLKEGAERDLHKAREAFEKAVECDPQNEEAWLSLLDVMARQKDTKAHNRLFGELVKRFPGNKQILVLAGNEALQRKTYTKALAALESALALDPLDKQVKVSAVIARVFQTREYIRKARPVAGHWAALEPLLEDRPGRGHLMLSRWIARVRQGLIDPDPESAEQARKDAARLAPSAVERLFLEESLAAAYNLKTPKTWTKLWKEALEAASPDWAMLARMLDLLGFVVKVRGKELEGRQCGKRVLEFFVMLLRQDLGKDPDGLLGFLDYVAASFNDRKYPAVATRATCLRGVWARLDRMVEKSVNRAQLDPRVRLANLIAAELIDHHYLTGQEAFLDELEAVVTAAAAAGMTAVEARAKAMLNRWDKDHSSDHSGYSILDEFDDEDDDGFEDDKYQNAGSSPTGETAIDVLLQQYVASVLEGNLRDVATIRQALLESGIPEESFAEAVALAEQAGMPAPHADKKPKAKISRKPKAPPPSSPNQMELFD